MENVTVNIESVIYVLNICISQSPFNVSNIFFFLSKVTQFSTTKFFAKKAFHTSDSSKEVK